MLRRATRNRNDYGGRGITVCDEVARPRTTLARFVSDMVECPDGHSIDRIDNDGPYHKDNCRWATRKEQQRNMRNSRIITHAAAGSGTVDDWVGLDWHFSRRDNLSTEDGQAARGGSVIREVRDVWR